MPHCSRLAALACASSLLLPAAASAAGWQRITSPGTANATHVSLARSSDGALHVAYVVSTSDSSAFDTIVPASPSGAVTTVPIAQHWYFMGQMVAVTPSGSSVAAFVGGGRLDTDPTGTQIVAGPPYGSATLIHPSNGDFAYSPVTTSAATSPDGTLWNAFIATGQLRVQRGTSGDATANFEPAGYQSYDAALGIDGDSGAVWVASWGLGDNSTGQDRAIFVQQADASTGAPIGSATRLGHGSGLALDSGQPMAISGRGTGHAGVYAILWKDTLTARRFSIERIGGSPMTLATAPRGSDLVDPVLTHDSAGRVWAAWLVRRSARYTLQARRSNLAGTAFGRTTSLAVPAASFSVYDLAADGVRSDGELDVVARLLDTKLKTAEYLARLRAPLTLTASKRTVAASKGAKVILQVTDPDAIAGAAILARGPGGMKRTLHTDSRGRATLKIAKGSAKGRWTLTASAKAHGSATAAIVVA